MGKYFVEFEEIARNDLKFHYKSGNTSTIKKIEKILLELTENPFSGIGQPEELKYNFKWYWSRRSNQKDLIVYRVEAEIVSNFVVSAMGHYSDK